MRTTLYETFRPIASRFAAEWTGRHHNNNILVPAGDDARMGTDYMSCVAAITCQPKHGHIIISRAKTSLDCYRGIGTGCCVAADRVCLIPHGGGGLTLCDAVIIDGRRGAVVHTGARDESTSDGRQKRDRDYVPEKTLMESQ